MNDHDVYAKLINAQFENVNLRLDTFEARFKAHIWGALRTWLAWTTLLVFGLYGALWASA